MGQPRDAQLPRAEWFRGELAGQLKRAGIRERVRNDIERIEREINAGRATTRDEIMNDMFLTLGEQEEYLDPYSGEVVVGTDQLGRFRWQIEGGDVVNALERSDWRRSKVRPRGGGGG